MLSKSLFTFLFVLGVSSVSFADTLTANFNFQFNDDGSLSTLAASQGQVIFSLNGDGSIAASLAAFNSSIVGFGFDSRLTALDLAQIDEDTPFTGTGWVGSPDNWQAGFYCPSCGFLESWQIGEPGVSGFYSSVRDLLGGGFARTNFFLFTANGDSFGADAPPVPEPAIPALLGAGLGLIGLGLIYRRKRSSCPMV